MARIKMHIPKAKLPFYPPCEVKCRLQNGVSTATLGEDRSKLREDKEREKQIGDDLETNSDRA